MQIMTHRIWHVQLNSRVLIAFNIKGHLVLNIDFEVLLSLLYKREGMNTFEFCLKFTSSKEMQIPNEAKKFNQNKSLPY